MTFEGLEPFDGPSPRVGNWRILGFNDFVVGWIVGEVGAVGDERIPGSKTLEPIPETSGDPQAVIGVRPAQVDDVQHAQNHVELQHVLGANVVVEP